MNNITIEIKGKNLETNKEASISIVGGFPQWGDKTAPLKLDGTTANEIIYKIALHSAALYAKLAKNENEDGDWYDNLPYISEELKKLLSVK